MAPGHVLPVGALHQLPALLKLAAPQPPRHCSANCRSSACVAVDRGGQRGSQGVGGVEIEGGWGSLGALGEYRRGTGRALGGTIWQQGEYRGVVMVTVTWGRWHGDGAAIRQQDGYCEVVMVTW